MFSQLLKNDFRKNPWNNLILMLFMSLSVTLAVSVFFVLMQLFVSISTMYETAKPPHFLQMHKGEIIQKDIDDFNNAYPGMKYWQTVPMIDVFGNELKVFQNENKQISLEECRLDISLVKQNKEYDLLLDENRKPLEIQKGEIGVPVILLEKYPIEIGNVICLQSGNIKKEFQVSAYVYDGQMNSTLCSSTRFLISDEDFYELFGKIGETEYLIEAYFTDSSMAADYQSAYEQSEMDLPKNGQAITYTMIFLLSALTDIMMAMVFLVVGIGLIAIALLALRYSILTTIEGDKKEIGTMKALGVPYMGIRQLYLGKIRFLMVIGCILGYMMALFMSNFLFQHMSRTFGKQPLSIGVLMMGIGVCLIIYGVILFFAKKTLKRIRKATVVDTLVLEQGFGREQNGYRLVLVFMIFVSFLVMLPCLLVDTMKGREFVTYMGNSVHDVLLEIEQGDGLECRKEKAQELFNKELMQGVITGYDCFRRVRLQAVDCEGEIKGIHIDTGKRAGEGLQYLEGEKPKEEYDLALSCLIADELGKTIGDEIIIIENGNTWKFRICGIYQDVTSGGRTAKAIYDFTDSEAEQYTFQLDLADIENSEQRIVEWRQLLGKGYSIEFMEVFIEQTLGGVISQVDTAAVVTFCIGIGLILLIVVLFMQLRMVREANFFAIKKAIGIPYKAICLQELYPIIRAGGVGTMAGVGLSVIFGDDMVSMLFGVLGLGIKKLEFTSLPFEICLGIPMVLLIVLNVITLITCRKIKDIDMTSNLNE